MEQLEQLNEEFNIFRHDGSNDVNYAVSQTESNRFLVELDVHVTLRRNGCAIEIPSVLVYNIQSSVLAQY